MEDEISYIRDKQFEFAASHLISLRTSLCIVCVLCYLNKLLHFARRFDVFVDFVQQLDPIGVGN